MFDQIYLTGFKKFGNHDVNPTQLVSEHFAKQEIPGLKCSVVEVTTKDADAYIESIKQELVSTPNKKILNIHFGVGPNTVYRFEKCCYNNKDFGIPDNIGYQPSKEKICPQQSLEHPLLSKLDVVQLSKTLGKDFPTDLSVDPGRYLCNYLYFKSSNDLSKHEHIYSLFIHFPVLKLSPHERNIKFVESLISLLLKKQNLQKN